MQNLQILNTLLKKEKQNMTYKVQVEKEVIGILNKIDEYCIEHYGNYDFGKKLFNEIVKMQEIIKDNPNSFYEIKPNHHKIALVNLGYSLYYHVDKLRKKIIIYKLKSFKQEQQVYLYKK